MGGGIAREVHSVWKAGAGRTARQFSTTERKFNPSLGEETASFGEKSKILAND